jgi:hypothetical protein
MKKSYAVSILEDGKPIFIYYQLTWQYDAEHFSALPRKMSYTYQVTSEHDEVQQPQ